MDSLESDILEQLIAGMAEAVLVARVDSGGWPVVFANPAFAAVAGAEAPLGRPFADVLEQVLGRDVALEASQIVRSHQASGIPVEKRGREYLLALQPLGDASDGTPRYYAAYWRQTAGASLAARGEARHALQKARRRIRDLTREDPVTGLMNTSAFRDVLSHDQAVAAREKTALGVVVFMVDDFDAYFQVFGRHATDSCLRRVAQALRRSLRRASDVAARLDGGRIAVLSHGSDEGGVREFATRIAEAVRALGIHHPRSSVGRFVTVSFDVTMLEAGGGRFDVDKFLAGLTGG